MANAEVFNVFSERIDDLSQTLATQLAESRLGAKPRPWYLPKGWKDENRDVLDVPNLHLPDFNRDDLNRRYVECMTPPVGTVGDIIALKLQIDYMAAEERALRLRHATPIRCIAHSLARRKGHAESDIFPNVVLEVANAIKHGAGSSDTGASEASTEE